MRHIEYNNTTGEILGFCEDKPPVNTTGHYLAISDELADEIFADGTQVVDLVTKEVTKVVVQLTLRQLRTKKTTEVTQQVNKAFSTGYEFEDQIFNIDLEDQTHRLALQQLADMPMPILIKSRTNPVFEFTDLKTLKQFFDGSTVFINNILSVGYILKEKIKQSKSAKTLKTVNITKEFKEMLNGYRNK